MSQLDIETIEQRTYRLLQIANKNDEGQAIDSDFGGEMFNSLLENTIFKLHCKMIELAIAEEREASGWISVKDRLPICEFEHEELGVMVSQTVNIYGVSVDDNHGQGFGELHGDGRWVCYGGEHDFMNVKEVTHWSPLPAAPKAEAPR